MYNVGPEACGRRDSHMVSPSCASASHLREGQKTRVPAASNSGCIGRPAKDDGNIFDGALKIVGNLLEEGMVARVLGYRSSSRKS